MIDDKIPMEDHILNLETKRKTDRRCEFWLEFENGVKMFAEMLDPVPADTSLMPPIEGSIAATDNQKREVMIKEDANDEEEPKGARETTESKGGILKSSHDKPPTEIEAAVTFDDEARQSELPKVTKKPTV